MNPSPSPLNQNRWATCVPCMMYDAIEANLHSTRLPGAYGLDVLALQFPPQPASRSPLGPVHTSAAAAGCRRLGGESCFTHPVFRAGYWPLTSYGMWLTSIIMHFIDSRFTVLYNRSIAQWLSIGGPLPDSPHNLWMNIYTFFMLFILKFIVIVFLYSSWGLKAEEDAPCWALWSKLWFVNMGFSILFA